MFKYGIACGLEELPISQPVSLRGSIEKVCEIAKKIGYETIELHVKNPKQYDVNLIEKAVTKSGLSVCAVANGMEYTVKPPYPSTPSL